MPEGFDKERLARALRDHEALQSSGYDNGAVVRTFAQDLSAHQVATVRFDKTPSALVTTGPYTIEIPESSSSQPSPEYQDPAQPVQIYIDRQFIDITVLSCPPADTVHEIDILAVSGLGSHPFGSFTHKDDGHMWLSDSLPSDIPSARVMIYGYESGLQSSSSFANLGDLASGLKMSIRKLQAQKRRLILVGHSLGGLLIKEAIIQMAEDNSNQLNSISGIVFFGVPNDGMSIESLIPIVGDQPNRFLLESLSSVNSQILYLQKKNFFKVSTQMTLEMFCFYETQESPTAKKVRLALR